MTEQVFLSRRNLLILLSKLDRVAAGEHSSCTVIKYRNETDPFVQSMDAIAVTAVEDKDFYAARNAGAMHPNDEVALATKIYGEIMEDQGLVMTVPSDSPVGQPQVFAGFDKGEQVRFMLAIDELDTLPRIQVTVKFPDNTYSVSSSFLRGLFEGSMKTAGSEAAFLKKYRVDGAQFVRENFMSIVYRYFILHK